MIALINTLLFVQFSFSAVSPNMESKSKTCPKDEVLLAQEYLLLESVGRRAFLKAKDSCYKNAKTKYIHQLKTERDSFEDVVFVDSVKIKKVEYNKTYDQHDVFIEAITSDGKKLEDKFRFMRLGKPGGPRPKSGCALLSISPSKAYVLNRCKAPNKAPSSE